MSAGFDINYFRGKSGEKHRQCSVISIYEDLGARNLLLELADSLSRQFSDDFDFHFDWWRFKYLADPAIAMEAARIATHADLILLAPKSPDLPECVQMWFDGWLPHRDAVDGALVLVQPSTKGRGAVRSTQLPLHLRHSAQRARLDCLQVNAGTSAMQITPTLSGISLSQLEMDQLLHEDKRPTHWGINE